MQGADKAADGFVWIAKVLRSKNKWTQNLLQTLSSKAWSVWSQCPGREENCRPSPRLKIHPRSLSGLKWSADMPKPLVHLECSVSPSGASWSWILGLHEQWPWRMQRLPDKIMQRRFKKIGILARHSWKCGNRGVESKASALFHSLLMHLGYLVRWAETPRSKGLRICLGVVCKMPCAVSRLEICSLYIMYLHPGKQP